MTIFSLATRRLMGRRLLGKGLISAIIIVVLMNLLPLIAEEFAAVIGDAVVVQAAAAASVIVKPVEHAVSKPVEVPTIPTIPTLPPIPTLPTVPTVPTLPTVPTISIAPTVPTVPPTQTVPTLTASPTLTLTSTPTNTMVNTPTPTLTATATPIPGATATNTPTNTPVLSVTNTSTNTPSPTATNTPVGTATNTPLPTNTPTNTPILPATNTPTATPTLGTPVRLGNLVWYDKNNNGLVDVGESGIPGVIVQLFREGDDPTTATPIATDVTDANGFYLFENLQPGRYFVYLPIPPARYPASSTPTNSTDDGVDNDDNGIQATVGGAIRSPVVQLTIGGESTTDGDDANGNLTIDFGFWGPQPDLVIVKTVKTEAELILPGLVVTYSLAYSNVGTATAVGVVITETVSQYTTFAASATTPGWSCANGAVAGTKCILALGNVAPGQRGNLSFAVRLNADVGSGVTISNLVVIGTEVDQVEDALANNQYDAKIVVRQPTNLPEGSEPERSLPVHLYLPMVTN